MVAYLDWDYYNNFVLFIFHKFPSLAELVVKRLHLNMPGGSNQKCETRHHTLDIKKTEVTTN